MACNVADLGGSCVLIGLIGEDPEGALLSSRLKDFSGVDAFLSSDHTRPTSHKVRYCVRGQQILRFDRESSMFAGPDIEREILAAVTSNIADCSVLVLSDYAKGTLTDWVLSESIKLAQKHCIPVIVDPKSKDLSRYFGATLVTPNLKEAEAALGTDLTNDSELFSGARVLLTRAGIESILITRGPEGMTLLEDFESKALHVRSQAKEVFDVVGAGDTVIAMLALAMGAKVSRPDAARLASLAAEIVVGKRGTATAKRHEVEERLSPAGVSKQTHSKKVFSSVEGIRSFVEECRKRDKRVGFTNGVFDLVHAGHVSLLEFARNSCDCLIIGINSDASAQRLDKGPRRPINTHSARAKVLSAFEAVDAVVIFDDDTPLELIRAVQPDLLVKGGDYSPDEVVGAEFVKSYGGRVEIGPFLKGHSTTSILRLLPEAGTAE